MKKPVGIALLLLGVTCMIVSLAWRRVATTSLVYNKNDAQAYQKSVAELHGLQGEWGGHGRPPVAADVQAERTLAQASFDEQQAKLARARNIRENGSGVVRWSGVFSALIGIFLLMYRGKDD